MKYYTASATPLIIEADTLYHVAMVCERRRLDDGEMMAAFSIRARLLLSAPDTPLAAACGRPAIARFGADVIMFEIASYFEMSP